MRKIPGLLLCLLLTACISSHVESERTASAKADLQPLQSLLVFIESSTPETSRYMEEVVAKKLSDAGVAAQLGMAQLTHAAAVDEVLAKAQELDVDGALIIAVEWIDYIRSDKDQAPIEELLGMDSRRFSPRGNYSARLYDVRVKGKRTKLWQAKLNSQGGNLTTTEQVVGDVGRQIVNDLRREDLITAPQN